MNIFRRLKNLWKLSEYTPLQNSDPKKPGMVVSSLIKEKDKAVIVDMHDPLKIDLGDEQQ